MPENHQHWHRCTTPDCPVSWICARVNCGVDEACDACEQRRFVEFHEAHGFTVSQPELIESEEA